MKTIHITFFYSSKMQKKVDAILTIVLNSYKQCSNIFHEFFINEFKTNIISENLHDKRLLKFDEDLFCSFIDTCIIYRLGISTKEPKIKDIVYDLSMDVNPEIYSVPLDSVLEKLIYSALPSNLVYQLKFRIDSYNLDESIVNLIISKLENGTG